jgi:adenine deaminase
MGAMDLSQLVARARGDEPADLLLRGGQLVNVLSGDVHPADVAVVGETVVGVGGGYEAREVVDVDGQFVCPGFIDAHVHVESSMVPPREFARAVVPRGVTTVVTDPHEIANVLGLDGIKFMLDDAADAPFTMFVNAPSCVPATHMGTAGAELTAADLVSLRAHSAVLGLAEVMNFPGVVSGDEAVLGKIRAFRDRVIDGHCPGLTGAQLNAYVAAGIRSDHESTTLDEAREKLRLGLTVFLRQATNAKNLLSLLPLVTPEAERHLCLCTDDRQPPDLLDEGSIDHLVRMVIAEGVPPLTAIRMASLNTAEHFRLLDRGAIAPGRRADVLVMSSLEDPRPDLVYVGGQLAAERGRMLDGGHAKTLPPMDSSVQVDWGRVDLAIPAAGAQVRVIGVVPDQIVTRNVTMDVSVRDGQAVADTARDLLKIAVIERHGRSGAVGLGFVTGIGLARGAIAGTIAHDHHNLIVIGADDQSMLTSARAVAKAGGGQAVAQADEVMAVLPLPIAGLMSDRPIGVVRDRMARLIEAARRLGSTLHDPFMAMSFLGLEVIPSLKLTDQGLVDVEQFRIVPLFLE